MPPQLYIAAIPDSKLSSVFPPERQAQLDATVSEPHRRQRYYVWKLLEYALFQFLGLTMEQVHFSLDSSGRWSCRECFFSLTHSKNAVAVAISHHPIGVDLERLDRPVHPGLPQKILTEEELAAFSFLEESRKAPYLLEKWCEKESRFKYLQAAQGTNPQNGITHIGSAKIAGENYCYAVVSEDASPLEKQILKEDIFLKSNSAC